MNKNELINLLKDFADQKPRLNRLDFDAKYFSINQRRITKARTTAHELLSCIALNDHITVEFLIEALRPNERLCLVGNSLEYTTGYYWGLEFRQAVCSACASAIWYSAREAVKKHADYGKVSARELILSEIKPLKLSRSAIEYIG